MTGHRWLRPLRRYTLGTRNAPDSAISRGVAQLWARSVPADATPGRLYLALRLAWPPHGIGPELPAAVR